MTSKGTDETDVKSVFFSPSAALGARASGVYIEDQLYPGQTFSDLRSELRSPEISAGRFIQYDVDSVSFRLHHAGMDSHQRAALWSVLTHKFPGIADVKEVMREILQEGGYSQQQFNDAQAHDMLFTALRFGFPLHHGDETFQGGVVTICVGSGEQRAQLEDVRWSTGSPHLDTFIRESGLVDSQLGSGVWQDIVGCNLTGDPIFYTKAFDFEGGLHGALSVHTREASAPYDVTVGDGRYATQPV